jgi:hypothetical protein
MSWIQFDIISLGFRVTAPNALFSGTEILVQEGKAMYVTIPLLNATRDTLRRLSVLGGTSSGFAQISVNSYVENNKSLFAQSNPVPLHFLALNSIGICPAE